MAFVFLSLTGFLASVIFQGVARQSGENSDVQPLNGFSEAAKATPGGLKAAASRVQRPGLSSSRQGTRWAGFSQPSVAPLVGVFTPRSSL